MKCILNPVPSASWQKTRYIWQKYNILIKTIQFSIENQTAIQSYPYFYTKVLITNSLHKNYACLLCHARIFYWNLWKLRPLVSPRVEKGEALQQKLSTCLASSRVGARTRARNPLRLGSLSWCRMGITKAAVLPDPVGAHASSSRRFHEEKYR